MKAATLRVLLGFIVGLAFGLLYGWLIQPVEYIDTAPASLRIDYRTDYVIMVAQSYLGDQDLNLATVRLAALGPRSPDEFVAETMTYAMENQFSQADIQGLNRLMVDLRAHLPPPEIGSQ